MHFTLELAKKYGKAFGYIGEKGIDSDILNDIQGNVALFAVGDKTFADLCLENTQTGEKYFFQNTNEGKNLGAAPMITLTRAKKLVVTNIDNSDFEVVESFGNKPWDITVEGLLIESDNHNYPQDKCKQLSAIFQANTTYKVICSMLNEVGINEIYFESLDEFKNVEGYNDTVKYQLKAHSTEPVEYTI